MKNFTKQHNGQSFTFSVRVERDDDMGAPWDEHDGHGPVTDWECRDRYRGGKRPGELILASDGRGYFRFYDYAEACKIALRDGWDDKPYNDGSETPRQQAAKAARADFEHLRAWCNDEWHWCGIIVTLLDPQGQPTSVHDSVWGMASDDQQAIDDQVSQCVSEILAGYGSAWGPVEKTTYAPLGVTK